MPMDGPIPAGLAFGPPGMISGDSPMGPMTMPGMVAPGAQIGGGGGAGSPLLQNPQIRNQLMMNMMNMMNDPSKAGPSPGGSTGGLMSMLGGQGGLLQALGGQNGLISLLRAGTGGAPMVTPPGQGGIGSA